MVPLHNALRLGCPFLALLALGAAAQSQESGSGARAGEWPSWLEDAMSEEAPTLRASKVVIGDGAIKSRLAGKPTGKPQAIEGGWYLATDIGTPAPLECWVFTDTIDPATMAANIAELSIQSSVRLNGPLDRRAVYFVDAGAYDGSPYLALEWLYGVGETSELLAGLAKVRVAVESEVTFACAHNSLGYRETFALAFEQFVREAEILGDADEAYYEEIIVQKIGDQPIGIAHSSFTLDANGDTEIMTIESSLMPVDSATLTVSDTWHLGYSRPDGRLINQHVAASENGELTMQLALEPTEPGRWRVSGTFQGKEISHELAAAAHPMSELGQMLAVRNLLADHGRDRVELDVWVPSADPTQFMETEVAFESSGREHGLGELTMGPLAIAAEFDRAGSLLHGRIDAGPSQMFLERVWARGTPP